MFICYECLKVFDEPKIWVEKHGLNTPPYEHYSGCPSCGGAYTEAHRCECCDEWIDDVYIKTEDDKRYCLECYRVYHLGDED